MISWDGEERRENHGCKQIETIGTLKEFMQSTKGYRTTLIGIVVTILLQVGTFLYLWGSLTEVVKKNTHYVWNVLTPVTTENTRNIDRILAKWDTIQFVVGQRGERGIQGIQGLQGEKGNNA